VIALLVAILGPILKVTPAPPPVPEGATGVKVFRSSERYLSYRYLLTALTFLPMLLPVLAIAVALQVAAAHDQAPQWLAIGIPALYLSALAFSAALALVSIRLDYDFHSYVATDRSLRIRQGIWEQVEATLTYANVQNVRVTQGPVERFFGIASVVVDTAGSAGKRASEKEPRGLIRGIEDAAELRDRIMERMRASKSAGLGDPEDHEHAHAEPGPLDLELLRSIRDEARGLAAEARGRRGTEGAT
jgi:membrane protein YdbS with pleckstrin-like domain